MKIILLLLATNYTYAETCKDYYLRKAEDMLSLSLQDFSKKFAKKYEKKAIKNNICYYEKAQLIESYYYSNDLSLNSLKEELVHVWGIAGNYEKAIYWIEEQLKYDSDDKVLLTPHNNYLLAKLAFFKKDEDKFVEHYNIINDDFETNFSNSLITIWLDKFIENFDRPYKYIVENQNIK